MSKKPQFKRKISFRAAAALSAVLLLLSASNATAQEVRLLKIEVLSGEGAFNSIKDKVAKEIGVRVLDQSDKPLVGAIVVFQLPTLGPSGTFPDGKTVFTSTTDNTGHATTLGLRPNVVEGRFNVIVTASYQGLDARANVAQTNTLAGGQIGPPTKSHKKYWILAIIGGAAAGGVLATRGGSSTPAPGSSVSVGVISVGVPR